MTLVAGCWRFSVVSGDGTRARRRTIDQQHIWLGRFRVRSVLRSGSQVTSSHDLMRERVLRASDRADQRLSRH